MVHPTPLSPLIRSLLYYTKVVSDVYFVYCKHVGNYITPLRVQFEAYLEVVFIVNAPLVIYKV
jgi:hypothetical protein